MPSDLLQQAWQTQSSRTHVAVDTQVLQKQVEQSQAQFRATIFWRDVREIGAALAQIPFTFWMGSVVPLPWTWYLSVPANLWVAGWILVDRRRHPQRPSEPGEPLIATVEKSLAQVDHQIRLLRDVFWWYQLPFILPMSAFFIHVFIKALIETPPQGWSEIFIAIFCIVFIFAVLAFVFWLIYSVNQKVVRVQLEPRRQELLDMLTCLEDEPASRTSATRPKSASVRKSKIFWSWIVIAGASLAIILGFGFSASLKPDYDGAAKSSGPQGEPLATLIIDLRKQSKLVGLAAMVTVDGEVVANAAVGERMIGSGVPLDLGDQWHLGSISKSITATMIARLIEAGQMQWTDTIGQRFPEAGIHDDWKPVTLEQLLTHTSGAPANFGVLVKLKKPAIGPELTRERRLAVLDVMKEKPTGTPGKTFAYSNVGYTIAAAMAEEATGVSWEDLVKREVFAPLELAEAGFGPPKSPAKTLDQPRGHLRGFLGKTGVSDTADNTPIIGPAGTVHMTLADLSKHGAEHMRGELGTSKLLTAETFKRLHTPRLNDYACGWVVKRPTQTIPRMVYWHNGSNTMWYALVVFIPDKNMVVAVASNDGDIPKAESAAWKIVEWSANRFKTDGDAELRKSFPAEYAKKSPFAAVRWQAGKPEVKVGDEWFKLVSLDGIDVADIIAFSEKTFGKQSQKRFEEDLVELLTRMGHPPGDQVKLVVQTLQTAETRIVESVAMTEENRKAIKAAALRRGE